MFDVEKILLTETINENDLSQLDIQSPNGLHYTIINDTPDNQHTYLKLTYKDEIIFEYSIDKFVKDAVFDTEYFKQTQHHYLFRMDKKSLKQFLNETDKAISLVYSFEPYHTDQGHYYQHNLYINNVLYRLNAGKRQVTDDSKKQNTAVMYFYNDLTDTRLNCIVKNHSHEMFTFSGDSGYNRQSHYAEYFIVGDHFRLIGVYNGPFHDVFSLRYSPKTLELHIHNFKREKTYLTEQSIDDIRLILKRELFDWLAIECDEVVKKALNDFDFFDLDLNNSLKILEMAVI